ncbi:KptA family-domain-containing protein [Mycena vulgaris]|nr:KptA family-domain-containing protein [Mycena vulgaris]
MNLPGSLPRSLPRIFQGPKSCGRRLLSATALEEPWDREHSEAVEAESLKFFTTRLNWLLRHGTPKAGLEIRPDGYVRLDDVKGCYSFRYLSSSEFDEMLRRDAHRRRYQDFNVVQDFDIRQRANALWIRSKGYHSVPNVNARSTSKILSAAQLPVAVYPLDLQLWTHVGRHGIQQHGDRFIHLIPDPERKFCYTVGANFDVCIYVDVAQTLAAGIQLFRTRDGRVLSNGDQGGVLPPYLFKEVVRVHLERETLLKPPY